MPLQWQSVEIPLAGGLETKIAEERISIGKMRALENGEFDEHGRINKRNVYGATAMTLDETDAVVENEVSTIVAKDDRLLMVASQKQDDTVTVEPAHEDHWSTYGFSSAEDKWVQNGFHRPARLSVRGVGKPHDDNKQPDVAITDDYIAYAWHRDDGGTIEAMRTIIDRATGQALVTSGLTGGALALDGGVKVIATQESGDDRFIFVRVGNDGANDKVEAYTLEAHTGPRASPGLAWSTSADISPDLIWDCCHLQDGANEYVVVAYARAGAFNDIRVHILNADGTSSSVNSLTPVAGEPNTALTVFTAYDDTAAATRLVFAWQDGVNDDLCYSVYSTGLVQQVAPQAYRAFASDIVRLVGCADRGYAHNGGANKSSLLFFAEHAEVGADADQDQSFIMRDRVSFDGLAAASLAEVYRFTIASKAFDQDNKPHLWLCHSADFDESNFKSNIQPTYFLVCQRHATGYSTEADTLDVVVRALAASAGGAIGYNGHGVAPDIGKQPSNVALYTSGTVDHALFAGIKLDQIQYKSEYLDDPTFTRLPVGIDVEFSTGPVKHASIGPNIMLAGGVIRCVDSAVGFESGFHLFPDNIIPIVQAGGALPAGSYWYTVTYEYTDEAGQIHRSAPCIPMEESTAGGNLKINITEIPYLTIGDYGKIYNTKVVLWRTKIDAASTGPFYRITDEWNDPSGDTFDVLGEELLDTVIEKREFLYTTGGVLENSCPPTSSIMTSSGNRVFLVPDESRNEIWFSKEKKAGLPVEFSDLLVNRLSSDNEITALAEMDGKVIVFTKDKVAMFHGVGPNDFGVGVFSDIIDISTDSGCTDQGSVQKTSLGVTFKNDNGLFLLGRNLQVEYIGYPIHDYAAQEITRIVVPDDKPHILFLMPSSDEIMMYDYILKSWSLHDMSELTGGLVDACVMGGVTYLLDTEGDLYESSSGYTGIIMDVQPAWLNLGDVQGFKRCKRLKILGEYRSPCTMTVELKYDYKDSAVGETITYSVTAAEFGSAGDPLEIEIKPAIQQFKALGIRIVDSSLSGNNESYKLSSVQLEVGTKGRLQPTKLSRTA